MRKLLIIIIAIVLTSCTTEQEPRIYGQWDLIESTQSIIIRIDNSYRLINQDINYESTYTIENNNISFDNWQGENGSQYRLSLLDDLLILTNGGVQYEYLRRKPQ